MTMSEQTSLVHTMNRDTEFVNLQVYETTQDIYINKPPSAHNEPDMNLISIKFTEWPRTSISINPQVHTMNLAMYSNSYND